MTSRLDGFRRAATCAFALGLGLGIVGPGAAHADPIAVPVVTIYPGDTISDAQIKTQDHTGDDTQAFLTRSAAVGKMARRTLLPERPIPLGSVEEARAVKNGALVRVVFQDGDLTISSSGVALQNATIGQVIRVRNSSSGLVVSGAVMPDGSVRVGAD